MEPYQPCIDISDISELSPKHNLYLMPVARLNITASLPSVRFPGRTISNWEVMERIKEMAAPDKLNPLKVTKTTLEYIRFDAEVENRPRLSHVVARIDGKTIKLSGYPELLKLRAAEAKTNFPTRHDWDRFFRDNKAMNEMKAGERPDTLFIQGLPTRWFAGRNDEPNTRILLSVFETFGEVRCSDIPLLDPYRSRMKESISGSRSTFSNTPKGTFDAYVQYREYICFVKAMDAMRGMKLVYKDGVKAFSATIKVDFDKTKHLSDTSIRRRTTEREKLIAKERELEDAKRREEKALQRALQEKEHQKEEEKRLKGKRQKEREEKRKQRILRKLKKKEAEHMSVKIAIEERKLLMAQRKLESIRLLDDLFERVKANASNDVALGKEKDLEVKTITKEQENPKKRENQKFKKESLIKKERSLRKKIVSNIKMKEQQHFEERKEKLKKTMEEKDSFIREKRRDSHLYSKDSSDSSTSESESSSVYSKDGSFSSDHSGGRRINSSSDRDYHSRHSDGQYNKRGRLFRPRGRSRGGFLGILPNPNVPVTSFYMSSINQQYYKSFNKIPKDNNNDRRSSSRSSERKICRKVLSRKRSRSKSSSCDKLPKMKSKSKSPSKERTLKLRSEINPTVNVNERENPGTSDKINNQSSDLSLSLSDSEDWALGSPERKNKPLNNPNWQPYPRRRRTYLEHSPRTRYNHSRSSVRQRSPRFNENSRRGRHKSVVEKSKRISSKVVRNNSVTDDARKHLKRSKSFQKTNTKKE